MTREDCEKVLGLLDAANVLLKAVHTKIKETSLGVERPDNVLVFQAVDACASVDQLRRAVNARARAQAPADSVEAARRVVAAVRMGDWPDKLDIDALASLTAESKKA